MITEERLLDQWRSGNEEALFSIMLHYYNDLYKYAIKFTADIEFTKDTVNQFFVHVWDHRVTFSKANNIRTYILAAFKRFLITRLRKRAAQRSVSCDELVELPYEEYIVLAQEEAKLKKALLQAIQSLPPRQKELIQLRFYEKMSYEEIARMTSLAPQTVYNKLHLAIKNLRSQELVQRVKKSFLFFFL